MDIPLDRLDHLVGNPEYNSPIFNPKLPQLVLTKICNVITLQISPNYNLFYS
jgi:Fur family zinc uptake transcriptional regulator